MRCIFGCGGLIEVEVYECWTCRLDNLSLLFLNPHFEKVSDKRKTVVVYGKKFLTFVPYLSTTTEQSVNVLSNHLKNDHPFSPLMYLSC